MDWLHENSGFVCKPKDYEEIGKRVIELLQNEELRFKMGAHARKRVVENFTLKNFIEQYEEVYHQVNQTNTSDR